MTKDLSGLLRRGLIVWFLIILAESVHGVLRTMLLEPLIGDLSARQIGVVIGTAMILAITFMFVRWLKANSGCQFLLIGLMWVVLTVGFEILLGRYVMSLSWERILSDYDVANGGLMLFGLLAMLFAPWIMAKLVDEI